MQGLCDGYFVLPATVGNYLASHKLDPVPETHADVRGALEQVESRIQKLLGIGGKRTPDSFHRELGQILWDHCGMARSEAGLEQALLRIPELQAEFHRDLRITGTGEELNQSLEKAGRIADFFELASLMCRDALDRKESCGGHFREESQTKEGEARRNDQEYCHVSAWQWTGEGSDPVLHKEHLDFEYVKPSFRSYA
jgi:succinate dehydrogenase / fumarate reductase flavoprotein subunit